VNGGGVAPSIAGWSWAPSWLRRWLPRPEPRATAGSVSVLDAAHPNG